MKILVYFGHPAQYLFLKHALKELSKKYKIIILIKSKDVLEDLIKNDNFQYTNILTSKRGNSKFSIILSLFKRLSKIFPIVIKEKPNLMISTDATIAQIGKFLGIKRITITEDDYEIIKSLADISYPLTNTILCPQVCKVGKWEYKKIGYSGYQKLAYLHPNYFKIDPKFIPRNKYVLIRLSSLSAYHDIGIKGLTENLLQRIIKKFEEKNYTVYLSSESQLSSDFQKYHLSINPTDMHQILANASFLICDSQSMSVEAAMLGIPSIRYSSFAGRISVLEELEHKYHLTYGIKPGLENKLLDKIDELLEIKDLKIDFQKRKNQMLADKIDVTTFLIWFIENYPESEKIMTENPDYQLNFK